MIVKSSAVDEDADSQEWGGFKKLAMPSMILQLRPALPQLKHLEQLTQNGDAVHDTGRRPGSWLCSSSDHRVRTASGGANNILTCLGACLLRLAEAREA